MSETSDSDRPGDEPDEQPGEEVGDPLEDTKAEAPVEGDDAPDDAPDRPGDRTPPPREPTAYDELVARVQAFYDENVAAFWVLVIVVPLGILGLGILVAPELVWDRFVWQYLWGPIVADAQGAPAVSDRGVIAYPGYTAVSYVVYGPTLGLAIFGLMDMLRRLRFDVDATFVLALSPMIVFGGMLRVMEDTRLFEAPAQYLFISPVIYFTLAFFAVGGLLLGVLGERVRRRWSTDAALAVLAVPAVAFLGIYLAVAATPAWAASFAFLPDPWIVAGIVIVSYALVAVDARVRGRVDPLVTVFAVGAVGLLLVLYASTWWIVGEPWSNVGVGRTFVADVLPASILGTIAITAGVTAAFWALKEHGGERWAVCGIFLGGFAIAILFGHALDAWATTIALKNPLGFEGLAAYGEKHPASNFIIQELGWPIWIAVKVLLAVVIIYMLDVEYARDFEDRPQLAGLIKLAILVLGLGPGIRDVGRVVLGV